MALESRAVGSDFTKMFSFNYSSHCIKYDHYSEAMGMPWKDETRRVDIEEKQEGMCIIDKRKSVVIGQSTAKERIVHACEKHI